MAVFKNLAGQKFDRLLAICPTDKRQVRCVIWLCRCDCGNLKEIASSDLLGKKTKSCGCLWKERIKQANTTHGDTANGKPLRLYSAWTAMWSRCSNPKATGYKYYGGRGIAVCDEWRDYKNFRDWALSNGYTNDLTIDRIDNDGNYEPSNCRWISKSENTRKAYLERNHNISRYLW